MENSRQSCIPISQTSFELIGNCPHNVLNKIHLFQIEEFKSKQPTLVSCRDDLSITNNFYYNITIFITFIIVVIILKGSCINSYVQIPSGILGPATGNPIQVILY